MPYITAPNLAFVSGLCADWMRLVKLSTACMVDVTASPVAGNGPACAYKARAGWPK